jgi:hypothetical protein
MADSNTCGQDQPLPKDLSCGKSGNQIYGDRRYLLLMGLFPTDYAMAGITVAVSR